jgi:hypothetical protein
MAAFGFLGERNAMRAASSVLVLLVLCSGLLLSATRADAAPTCTMLGAVPALER